MNEEIKKEWIKALRSGEYKQTTGVLCRQSEAGDSFCCLGVLCDLHARRRGSRQYWTCDRGYGEMSYLGGTALPVKGVEQWAGLISCDMNTLSHFNDRDRLTFEEIADWIEENL